MNVLVPGAAGFFGSRHARVTPAPDTPGAPRVTALEELTHAGALGALQLGPAAAGFTRGDIRAAASADQFVAAYGDERPRRQPLRRRVDREHA
ncbi:hypothetical protein ABZ499_33875 [Streptomyces sp. NPDC019990]|uniref:hypothetical protein n=1 Tax=Streptomyces sp. NPDC019990 TaxID=3154693 RepID=UPI003401EE11